MAEETVFKCHKHGVPKIFERWAHVSFPGCTEGFHYCPACEHERIVREKEQEAKERYERLTRGVPHNYLHADIKQFDAKLIAPVIEWADKPRGFLCVTGSCGVGKTHLACAVQKHLNAAGAKGQLVFVREMFLRLRKSFGENAKEKEYAVFAQYAPDFNGAEPAIFDDVGVGKLSDYNIEVWDEIIDRYYRNKNPMMITTNLNVEELSKVLGDRAASRISSGSVIALIGEDRRLTGHWTEKYD